MMIAAFDVHYFEDVYASAAAVLFSDYRDAEPAAEYTRFFSNMAAYQPGEFYKRELPCILGLLAQIEEPLDEFVVDGYVTLGRRPGLGQHLFDVLDHNIPVIGVAKAKFEGATDARVLRGKSRQPLHVTAAGLDLQTASEKIRTMHGNYRIPTLLKRVDRLARETVCDRALNGDFSFLSPKFKVGPTGDNIRF